MIITAADTDLILNALRLAEGESRTLAKQSADAAVLAAHYGRTDDAERETFLAALSTETADRYASVRARVGAGRTAEAERAVATMDEW